MSLDDLIGPMVALMFALSLLAERFAPRDAMPAVRFWRWRGLLFFIVIATVNTVLPMVLPLTWVAAHSLLPGLQLGVAGGFIVGWAAYSLAYYGLHRLEHHVPLLWRSLHQLHHSALRVDAAGFAMLHPLDLVAASMLSMGLLVGVLGLHPQAVGLVGLYAVTASLVQHLNLRTPRWLEWFMQRPEAHLRHHEFGLHAGNYAEWPVWDKLFGTYRAPPAQPRHYGFDAAAARRLGAMLLGIDVNPGTAPLANDRRSR